MNTWEETEKTEEMEEMEEIEITETAEEQDIAEKRRYFVESEGASLAVLCFLPRNPSYVVQIVHGIAEHKGRYQPLMEAIAASGGIALIHDLRGYGESVTEEEGTGYCGSDCHIVCRDIDAVYDSLGETSLPRFLLGFSMGALESSLYLAETERPLAGVILAGLPHAEPLVSLGLLGLNLLGLLAGEGFHSPMLNRYALCRYNRPFLSEIEAESDGQFLWLSNDVHNRVAFEEDPLCGRPNTVNGYETLLRMVRDVYRPATWEMNQPDVPILMLSGERDPVAGGDDRTMAGERYFRDLGFVNVENRRYRGMRHEIFLDIGREYPTRDLLHFVQAHLN